MNLLVWGTGNMAKTILDKGIRGNIVGFVESNPRVSLFMGRPVYTPDSIKTDYDLLFVASAYSEEILMAVRENGIPLDKVCFYRMPMMQPYYALDVDLNFRQCALILPDELLMVLPGYENSKEYNFVRNDLARYEKLNHRESFAYDAKYERFIYTDKYAQAGCIDPYFWQDLWAAQRVCERKPLRHYDIGSSLKGFIAHLLSFNMQVTMIDVRPLDTKIPGLDFICADATKLDNLEDDSIESLSALCSLEHFGLGRYGDPIDPDACFKAFNAIQKKICGGGYAYISVPVGKERLEFNAHRVFYPKTVKEAFQGMQLTAFHVAYENKIEYDADLHKWEDGYGYGLFEFRK